MAISEPLPMSDRQIELDPVGSVEIGERLGVSLKTVLTWHYDRMMPQPDWRIGPGPVWNWASVAAWALATNRLKPSASSAAITRGRLAELPDLVGVSEIADRLGIGRRAVHRRVQRGQMPPPRWQISGRGVWVWDDLKDLPTSRRTTR